MCSEVPSPVLVQLRPPSRLLYTPSPQPTLRWLVFSPVPSQITLESVGSMAMEPVE